MPGAGSLNTWGTFSGELGYPVDAGKEKGFAGRPCKPLQLLVELGGLEPPAYSLRRNRAPSALQPPLRHNPGNAPKRQG